LVCSTDERLFRRSNCAIARHQLGTAQDKTQFNHSQSYSHIIRSITVLPSVAIVIEEESNR